MAGNSIGEIFRLTTFGESHGTAIGGIIEGCPSGIVLSVSDIQNELDRRKPSKSDFSSPRNEDDKIEILSGVFEGKSLGTPIGFVIKNKDHRSVDYSELKDVYRPSHGDYTWEAKFGHRDYRGGGRSSARETASRVVGGAIARIFLAEYGLKVKAFVSQIGELKIQKAINEIDLSAIDDNELRCPDKSLEKKMGKLIESVKKEGDTLGGVITCVVKNCPVGLGEPVFSKLHAELGKALFSINSVKGVEFGAGFSAAKMKGSEHNDEFQKVDGQIKTKTNFSGGIQGGISNGGDIEMRVALKPVASIQLQQKTIDREGNPIELKVGGRHDVCVVPRAVPIVESMVCLVLADMVLHSRTNKS